MLQLVFPALFQTNHFLDLLGDAHLSKLDMLLARGRSEPLSCSSLEELLCKELGIARQHDWPIAPITHAAAGGIPGNEYWLRADPVHVRIEHDQLILNEISEPTSEEAAQLCEALNAHFGDEFSPQPLRPGAWVVKTRSSPDLVTTSLSQAIGKHIDPLLPTGNNALPWRKLLNEIQMLLFHHPVNQDREQRGEPVINSVWIWGGGFLPKLTKKSPLTVLSDHPDWLAVASFAGADIEKLPKKWSAGMQDHTLAILDEPHRFLRQGNFKDWLQAMHDFENNWLHPLLASGHPFRVDDPLQGSTLWWRKAYRWRFWQQAQKAPQRSFKVEPPPVGSGVDEFGNRY